MSTAWYVRHGRGLLRRPLLRRPRTMLAFVVAALLLAMCGVQARTAPSAHADASESMLDWPALVGEIGKGADAPVQQTTALPLDGHFEKWQSLTGIRLPARDGQNK